MNAFPHAVDCLRRLRDAGKRTLLLSNVPRPNDAVRTMMRGMGIDDALYTDILTSARRCAAPCSRRRTCGGRSWASACSIWGRRATCRCWRGCR